MRILTLNNQAFDLNELPDQVDEDTRFSVLDNSNPLDPDFYFMPLIFLESFNSPAIVLNIGGYEVQMPLDWCMVVGDKDCGLDPEVLPLTSINERGFDALLSPKSDVKAQHFSGPVGILRTYYNLFADEQGWRLALAFSVFFNVNLALFNLLPFPILDGGHITLAIFEAVRRRPIQGAMLEYVQTACAIAVMSFIAYVTFFDVSDFFSGKKEIGAKKAPADSAEHAPASAPAGK